MTRAAREDGQVDFARKLGVFTAQQVLTWTGPLVWGVMVGGLGLPLLPDEGIGVLFVALQIGFIADLSPWSWRHPERERVISPNAKLRVLLATTVVAAVAVAAGVGPNAFITGAVLFAASKAAMARWANAIAVVLALAALVGMSFLADPNYLAISGSALTVGHVVRDLIRFGLLHMIVWGGRREAREREAAEARAARAADDERARIARDLHDVVAHHVSVMTLQAEAARTTLPPGSRSADRALRRVADSGRSAMAELRRMLGILRASGETDGGLSPQPGIPQIADLVDDLRAKGMRITLKVEGDSTPVPAGVALSAYRVVQEALTNVRKHAGTSSVAVDVNCTPEMVELRVVDDGRTRLAGNGRGHGLVGMQERVALVGGTLTAGPRDSGAGWQVEAKLPTAAS